MDNIISLLSENMGAMIVRPAKSRDIKLCNEDFASCEMGISLPDGYISFLKKLNGFAWNGIEFYSTDQVTDLDTNYMLNDIVSANEDFRRWNEGLGLDHLLFLGRADDDFFVYNPQNNKYEVLDMVGRDVMEEYDSFNDMFVGIVWPHIPYDEGLLDTEAEHE